jgi:hypothetical protein
MCERRDTMNCLVSTGRSNRSAAKPRFQIAGTGGGKDSGHLDISQWGQRMPLSSATAPSQAEQEAVIDIG